MIKIIRQKLLRWYTQNARDLPWRRVRDPYKIWVSEVMLQQTRVDTVIPYYDKFLMTFPTINTLARADEQTVLKEWEGLGYYSRARNLHAAAKEVCEVYGGKLPESSADLQNLKGFGPYTSAAVASIAFGEPVACVDGNVKRVVSRLFATHEKLQETAQELMAREDPSSFNQAMMELGALVCTPRNPKCPICPVKSECKAQAAGTVDDYPAKKMRKRPKEIFSVSVVARNEGKILVTRRKSEGRYGGLWEFPTFDHHGDQRALEVARKEMTRQYLVSMRSTKIVGSFEHFLTHQTIHMTAVTSYAQIKDSNPIRTWVTHQEVHRLPFSKLQKRVADIALDRKP